MTLHVVFMALAYIASASAGFIIAEIITILIMNKAGGYDWSLIPLIRQIRETYSEKRRLETNDILNAVYNNVRLRVLMMFGIYIPILAILMAVCARYWEWYYIRFVVAFVVGVAIDGYYSIASEHGLMPQIMRYQGIKDGTKISFEKVVLDGLDEKNLEFVVDFGKEEVPEDLLTDLGYDGDLLVLLIPPTGGIIYDKII